MKIVHINTNDIHGGAGRAVYRLHTGLQRQGINSRLLVRTAKTNQDEISQITPSNNRGIEFVFRGLSRRSSLQDLIFPSTYRLSKHPWIEQTDVINLHNIHGHYFAYPALSRLSKTQAIVWTLHDMWGFTGHCSYSFDCQRWQSGCGHCPYPDTYPAIQFDTSALLWRIKKAVFQQTKLTLVTPSLWLANLASQSPVLSHLPVKCIPNSVDTDIFYPMDKQAARAHLKLPYQAFLILFMAEALDEYRKGSDLLLATLKKLSHSSLASQTLQMVTLGQGGETWRDQVPFPLHNLGRLDDESQIAAVYAAADVFLLPTRQDNLPNGLLESLACGTPCIAFNVGGVPEAISHLETGYLAEPESTEDLGAGIQRYLSDKNLCQENSVNCRKTAVQNYALEVQACRYIDLYTSLINPEIRSIS